MKQIFILFILTFFVAAACALKAENKENDSSGVSQTSGKTEIEEKESDSVIETDKTAVSEKSGELKKADDQAKNECLKAKLYGMEIDAKQTFPIDFAPFQKSCFVTFHEPDFDDPPLGEKFYIFKDGKQIFEFPDQNQAPNYTVKAVSFQDLNGDNLQETIVVGSVGEKGGTYYTSQVFVNNGKTFTTDADANMKLDDLTKIKDITDFVKKNKSTFFP